MKQCTQWTASSAVLWHRNAVLSGSVAPGRWQEGSESLAEGSCAYSNVVLTGATGYE